MSNKSDILWFLIINSIYSITISRKKMQMQQRFKHAWDGCISSLLWACCLPRKAWRALLGPAGTSWGLSGTQRAASENIPMKFLQVRNSSQIPCGGELEDSLSIPSPRPSWRRGARWQGSMWVLAGSADQDRSLTGESGQDSQGFPGGSVVKNLLAVWEMKEMQVQSLSWEDLMKKEMATHSSILALAKPMDRGAGNATVHGVRESQTWLSTHAQDVNSLEESPLKTREWGDPRELSEHQSSALHTLHIVSSRRHDPPGIAITVFILQTEHLRDVSLTQVGLPQLLLRLRSCSFLFNVALAHGEKTKAGHVLTCLVTGFDLLLVWEWLRLFL